MLCPSCGSTCRRLSAAVVGRDRDGAIVTIDRALGMLAALARDPATRLAVADLAGLVREKARAGEWDGSVTISERIWECTACKAPARIQRRTLIEQDLGTTRRRWVSPDPSDCKGRP